MDSSVSRDRLLLRLHELYQSGTLDYDVPDFDKLSLEYDKASVLVSQKLKIREQREWNAYGCGFASFYDSWFYQENEDFLWIYPGAKKESYSGVFVLFSLLEPMFAIGQGNKSWNEYGGAGYLPSLEDIDHFDNESVRALSNEIRQAIRAVGIPQVNRKTLQDPLSTNIKIETNLSHGNLTLFDAYFHWMD